MFFQLNLNRKEWIRFEVGYIVKRILKQTEFLFNWKFFIGGKIMVMDIAVHETISPITGSYKRKKIK